MAAATPPPAWQKLLAFAIIYFVWGSTFLAIRIGVSEVPPFLLAAMRFLAAGLALYEEIRRPRVEQNIANSARMTVNRMPDREQRAQQNQAIQQRQSQPSPPLQNDELLRQIDWNTPLRAAPQVEFP